MPKSNYLADKVNDHLHGVATFTAPSTMYLDAMSVLPTTSGGGTSTGFGRVALATNSTSWNASSGQITTNAVVIDWGTNTTGMVQTVVGIAVYDASSGGNLLWFGSLTTIRAVNPGEDFSVPVGGGQFTES